MCEQGLTAEAWARKRGHVALADLIARGGEDESESEARRALRMRPCASVTNAHARACAAQEEGGEEAAAGAEEETSTQRSRRKKKEMDAFESRGAKLKAVPADAPEEEEDAEGGSGGAASVAASAPPRDAPTWPEVAKALESGPKELVLERAAGGMADEGVCVDPALWRCTSLNLLKLSLKGADAAAPKPLRALPDGIRFLTGAIRAGRGCTAAACACGAAALRVCADTLRRRAVCAGMRTLILSNNALESLPEAIGALTARFSRLRALARMRSRMRSLAPLAVCLHRA